MNRILITLFTCALLITGCSSSSKRESGGAYYKDDGPGGSIPANIQAIPDAVPRIETHALANKRPYVVFGKRYVPITDEKPFKQKGLASWYGRKFHGNKTANGETYDMYAMTAAHPTLPLPSYARVTHAHSGRSVIVRINDRGPFHRGRVIDLSYAAAAKLDLIRPGQGPVIIESITHADIASKAYQRNDQPTPKAMSIPPARPPAASPVLTARAETSPIPVPGAQQSDITIHTPVSQNTESRPDALSVLYMATPEPQSGSSLVFLQYGAFSAHENAHQLATSLNDAIAHIEPRRAEISSAANIHRVHIGPYNDRAQAVNAALRIQSATGREATYTTQDAANQRNAQRSL